MKKNYKWVDYNKLPLRTERSYGSNPALCLGGGSSVVRALKPYCYFNLFFILKERIMLERINQMILEARKSKDKFRSTALSMVKAELINNEKSKKPMKEMKIIQGYAKKLEKASHAFKKTDKYEDLKKEIEIIRELIPKTMSRAEAKESVKIYFKLYPSEKQPGSAIKFLKGVHGDHNGQVLVPEIMMHLNM